MQELTLNIQGMSCVNCARSIESNLHSVDGVISVNINFSTNQAYIQYDPAKIQPADLINAVKNTGYTAELEIPDNLSQLNLEISGMSCAACAVNIEKLLNSLSGVKNSTVNFPLHQAEVIFDPEQIKSDHILKEISKIGYQAKSKTDIHLLHTEQKEQNKLKWLLIIALILSAPIFLHMILSLFKINLPIIGNPLIQFFLALPIQLGIGFRFYRRALLGLIHRYPGMDLLIVTGTSSAFIYSLYSLIFNPQAAKFYFEASAMIITLVLLGRYIEAKAKHQTSQAITKLINLKPQYANLLSTDSPQGKTTVTKVSLEQLKINDLVQVKPGEKIPADGIIQSGSTSIDESIITGESKLVQKNPGDRVIGATVNRFGSITVKIDRIGKDTVLAQIISIVEKAQASKAPIQRIADKVAGYFVQIILLIALVVLGLWWWRGGNFSVALVNAVAVTVIACPCALGLATPTAIMVASGKSANLGLLFKNGETIENLKKIDALVFDKTGTLTEGKPKVVDHFVNTPSNQKFYSVILEIEKKSEHPIGQAIVEFIDLMNLNSPENIEIVEFSYTPGKGINARTKKYNVVIGSYSFVQESSVKIDSEIDRKIQLYRKKGYSSAVVAVDNQAIAVFAIADIIKPHAEKLIKWLKSKNITPYMLTGDHRDVAYNIGQQLGIENIYPEVLPADKLTHIENLKKQHNLVGMVGDGVNDAPALTLADIGIAFASGTDIAIESSDLTIISDDLAKIITAIEMSRITVNKIKQNLFWAFIYNSFGIPLAAGGWLNPVFAAAAMAFSSVSVVLNSLSLKRKKIEIELSE